MRDWTDWIEVGAAKLAARKVAEAGGFVTFAQYDDLMEPERYLFPICWGMMGWGLGVTERKANMDKLAAFAACKAGLLRQTPTGYECQPKGEG